MTDIVWGPAINVDGKCPDWLTENAVYEWVNPGKSDWWHGVAPSKYEAAGSWEYIGAIRLPADHPHYAQPSPADTVTVRVMHEAEVRAAFVSATHIVSGENPVLDGWLDAFRYLGLIRPATKAERIAKSTSLPLADVERVLAAVEEGSEPLQVGVTMVQRGPETLRGSRVNQAL